MDTINTGARGARVLKHVIMESRQGKDTCVPPQYGGANCVGSPKEVKSCNEIHCPGILI